MYHPPDVELGVDVEAADQACVVETGGGICSLSGEVGGSDKHYVLGRGSRTYASGPRP